MDEIKQVLCIKWGTMYGPEYVGFTTMSSRVRGLKNTGVPD
jgi:hypothetical protein